METNNHHSLDIRTLIVLLTENEVSRDTVFGLLARECGVSVDKLVDAVTITPQQPETKTSKRIRWTDDRINTLVEMWNRGDRPGQIAEAFNCQTQVIYQKISQLRRTRTDLKPRTSRNPFTTSIPTMIVPTPSGATA